MSLSRLAALLLAMTAGLQLLRAGGPALAGLLLVLGVLLVLAADRIDPAMQHLDREEDSPLLRYRPAGPTALWVAGWLVLACATALVFGGL